jgi:hypothetical protein
MDNFNLKKYLSENKLTNEAENSNAWKSFNTPAGENFMADVNQEIATFQWVANIAKEAIKAKSTLEKILAKLGYNDPRIFDGTDMGFEIRKKDSNPFGYRGYIYFNLKVNEIDYKDIQQDPDFKKYFDSIKKATFATQPTNNQFSSTVEMKQTSLPK